MSSLLVLALGAGCTSAGNASHPNVSRATTTAGASAATLTAGEQANGSSMTLVEDQRVVVTLSSTYWRLQPPVPAGIVAVAVGPTAQRDAGCARPVGSGCGTVTATYIARRLGSATLTAHRDACGEALACAPAKRMWSLAITVVPR